MNDVALSNITVGNQPVALAVSSDGSTAYVANYKDNTVSVVNLTAETVTGTIAVGGQPTSVALTSSGILWVGGVGFLSEINTSSMTVTATEAVSGKTIVALGYSDSVGQIVATTVDSSNNVYADEIDPSSVTQGGNIHHARLKRDFQPGHTSECTNPSSSPILYKHTGKPEHSEYEPGWSAASGCARWMGRGHCNSDRVYDHRHYRQDCSRLRANSVAGDGYCGRFPTECRLPDDAGLEHDSDSAIAGNKLKLRFASVLVPSFEQKTLEGWEPGWDRFVLSHPRDRKKSRGWGTEIHAKAADGIRHRVRECGHRRLSLIPAAAHCPDLSMAISGRIQGSALRPTACYQRGTRRTHWAHRGHSHLRPRRA